MFDIECWRIDSNLGRQLLQVTAMPIVPQPLPNAVIFIKMGHSRPLFSLFSSFQYTVDSKQMFNI